MNAGFGFVDVVENALNGLRREEKAYPDAICVSEEMYDKKVAPSISYAHHGKHIPITTKLPVGARMEDIGGEILFVWEAK